ncbi:hypothetical protein BJ170DRAFT_727865 [Xylariales sp. AK1849]|nr:hypothetical protein BJ170DRAFT_727865 [Xylariales sp. AK1849]
MKNFCLALGLAALAQSQSLDWAAIDDTPAPTTVIVPIGARSTVVPYDSTAATASAAAQVSEHPLSQSTTASTAPVVKRDGDCSVQAPGSGPVPVPDTASSFVDEPIFSAVASNAPTPSGYTQTFLNLQGSNSAYAYMGYTALDGYDTELCASKCNAINGCSAFNIYFERDPTLDPGAACPNPPSTTVIKCVFWGGPVYSTNANNKGQYRNDFQVVIAGSNGYVNENFKPQPGYTGPTLLGQAAINEPSGSSTYMGLKIFSSGPFDPALCTSACTAQTEYNIAHPPASGSPQTCQFVNTYMLIENGGSGIQICSLYSASWDVSYATNTGQYRGNDLYTIDYSVTYTVET